MKDLISSVTGVYSFTLINEKTNTVKELPKQYNRLCTQGILALAGEWFGTNEPGNYTFPNKFVLIRDSAHRDMALNSDTIGWFRVPTTDPSDIRHRLATTTSIRYVSDPTGRDRVGLEIRSYVPSGRRWRFSQILGTTGKTTRRIDENPPMLEIDRPVNPDFDHDVTHPDYVQYEIIPLSFAWATKGITPNKYEVEPHERLEINYTLWFHKPKVTRYTENFYDNNQLYTLTCEMTFNNSVLNFVLNPVGEDRKPKNRILTYSKKQRPEQISNLINQSKGFGTVSGEYKCTTLRANNPLFVLQAYLDYPAGWKNGSFSSVAFTYGFITFRFNISPVFFKRPETTLRFLFNFGFSNHLLKKDPQNRNGDV